ncbi:DUF4124 domain-containing protein [Hydrogenophaga sp. 5NK40-0174]|uniref:DUF4124 domain-containing protein n=1 Tax=Hydrogenophaga sp. 5NK40-0174 TaxID=3127649 RepID=UPI00333FBE27
MLSLLCLVAALSLSLFPVGAVAQQSSPSPSAQDDSPPASPKMYRWKDANGRVHFSDKRPEQPGLTVQEIEPRSTNSLQPFVSRPSSMPVDVRRNSSAEVKPAPEQPPEEVRRRPLSVEASQESCEAQKRAYEASAACYAECGRSTFSGRTGFQNGRNNSQCGHCTDATMPDC